MAQACLYLNVWLVTKMSGFTCLSVTKVRVSFVSDVNCHMILYFQSVKVLRISGLVFNHVKSIMFSFYFLYIQYKIFKLLALNGTDGISQYHYNAFSISSPMRTHCMILQKLVAPPWLIVPRQCNRDRTF